MDLKNTIFECCRSFKYYDKENKVFVQAECITKSFRGNVLYNGTLWSVWQYDMTYDDGKEVSEKRLHCDRLQSYKYGWAYTRLKEDQFIRCHCPLKYLKMTKPINAEWRKSVQEYHKKKKERKKKQKETSF